MARKRDYKAEYHRRVMRGLEKGKTYSESRGHGKPRKPEFVNPFKAMQKTVNSFIGQYNSIFERVIHVPGIAGVDYMEGSGRVLPRWYTGTDEKPPNRQDLEDLWNEVQDKRPQNGYAITVSGITEDEYPGKEGEVEITLSYRLNRRVVEQAINNPANRTLADVVNEMLPGGHYEKWLVVHQVSFIDKE